MQDAVDLGGFHIPLGTAILPDRVPDFLYSTHIQSFPFAVVGLRVAAALARPKIEDMALNDTGVPLDLDFPALLAE